MDNNRKKLVMLCLLLLGCVATSILSEYGQDGDSRHIRRTSLADNAQDVQPSATSVECKQVIRVHVSGAVLEPGLYDLPLGARADAAIVAAGGMTEEAESGRVNLAKKLKDGMQIYVPMQKQYRTRSRNISVQNNATADGKQAEGLLVNVNTATAAELESLPGIGPALAQRIIAQRNVQPFYRVDDLLKVRGIGQAKLEKLRASVRVE